MHAPNEETMEFITKDAIFCYRVMPFGLKNIGTTYQRLMDRIFKQHIRQNSEVYINDIDLKSYSIAQHVPDLEVFGDICKYDMRLNLEKCAFGVDEGKLLNFMITHWGIEANLKRCITILEMHHPTNAQEFHKLNSRLASLSMFLPKLTENAKPF